MLDFLSINQLSAYFISYPEQLCSLIAVITLFLVKDSAANCIRLKTIFYSFSFFRYGLILSHHFLHDQNTSYMILMLFEGFLLFFMLFIDLFYQQTKHRVEKHIYILLWPFALHLLLSLNHWAAIYLSLELFSLPFYVWPLLSAHPQKDLGLLPYFLTQMGLNTLWLASLVWALVDQAGSPDNFFLLLNIEFVSGQILLMTSIFLSLAKLGAYPFHYWMGNFYQVSTRAQIIWLSFAPKFAALCFLSRLFEFVPHHEKIVWGIAVFIICGSFFGHFAAAFEKNIQRFLGYTAIAQNGFLIVPLIVGPQLLLLPVLFYLCIYSLGMSLFLHGLQRSFIEDLGDLFARGAQNKKIFIGYAVGLFTLAGFPPTPGFFAKIFLLEHLLALPNTLTLTFLLLISSVVALYYYMNWLLLLPRSTIDCIDHKESFLPAGH